MAQPATPPIVTTPSHTGQPYDATQNGACGRWDKLETNGGPADIHSGNVTGEFPDSAPWKQV